MMRGLSRENRKNMRRLRRRRAGELNLVSMIDVLTVLVFFLLVNAIGVSSLGVDLPDAASAPPDRPALALAVTVRATGLELTDRGGVIAALASAGTGYDLSGLNAVLERVKAKVPDESRITLLLEPGIPYDILVQVMDAVRAGRSPDGHAEPDLFPSISLGNAPSPKPERRSP